MAVFGALIAGIGAANAIALTTKNVAEAADKVISTAEHAGQAVDNTIEGIKEKFSKGNQQNGNKKKNPKYEDKGGKDR